MVHLKTYLTRALLRNSFLDTITIKLSSVSSWSLALFYVHINNDNKFNQTGHKKVLFEYKYNAILSLQHACSYFFCLSVHVCVRCKSVSVSV